MRGARDLREGVQHSAPRATPARRRRFATAWRPQAGSDMPCTEVHRPRKIALTGGPGAGKTAVLELVRRLLCDHVTILPESAGMLFAGGFPRGSTPPLRRAAQRAIFHVQRALEATTESEALAIVLCDRGTVDGGAYWPGPGDLWSEVRTTLTAEVVRYDEVIHLRTPLTGYNRHHPLRTESDIESRAIDEPIAALR